MPPADPQENETRAEHECATCTQPGAQGHGTFAARAAPWPDVEARGLLDSQPDQGSAEEACACCFLVLKL